MEKFINRSVVSGKNIPEDQGKNDAFAAAISNFSNPAKETAIYIPEKANELSGRKYILDSNPWGLKSIILSFNGTNECIYEENYPDLNFKMTIGIDGKYRENRFAGDSRKRELSNGRWIDDNTFVYEYYKPWADISKIHCICRFEADMISLKIQGKSTDAVWSQVFTGVMEK